jgi:hypothetical protein
MLCVASLARRRRRSRCHRTSKSICRPPAFPRVSRSSPVPGQTAPGMACSLTFWSSRASRASVARRLCMPGAIPPRRTPVEGTGAGTLEATVYRPGGDGPRAGRSLDGRRGRFPAAIESRYSSVQYARPCRWNPRPEVAASRWDACWPPPVWPGRDWTVSDSALLLGRALRARHASGWCVSSAANSVGFTGLVMW